MAKNIKIKPYFSVIAHTPDLVEVRSGVWNHLSYTIEDETSSGNLYRFIKALDGNLTVKQIAKNLKISRSEAEGIIDHLSQLNILEYGHSTAFDHYADIYLPLFSKREPDDINSRKIYILSRGKLSTDREEHLLIKTPLKNVKLIEPTNEIFDLLTSSEDDWLYNGIEFEETIKKFEFLRNNLVVLALEHIDPIFSKRFNQIAIALNLNWVHAALDGPFLF